MPSLDLKGLATARAIQLTPGDSSLHLSAVRRDLAVGNLGSPSNSTSPATDYSHGLAGVNQAANWLFANVLLLSFMALLFATLMFRWLTMLNSHLRRLFTMGQWDQRYWTRNQTTFWPRVMKHVILAPLGRQRHNREIQLSSAISIGTLPSRFHTLLLTLYVASNISYCLVLDWKNGNAAAILADLRGRSGVLAALNLIPTVLFALRNNPLIPILGVSYDTFNLLHRWCARIVVVESIVHTVCWAVNTAASGGLQHLDAVLAGSVSYQWGLVATSVFTLIFLTAVSPIRHAFYETFLNAHRLLAAFGLVGVYVHLDKANLPQVPYMQLCLALWVAEWIWRSCRIVYHNVSRRTGLTKVTVEALPAEACRVTFELARPWQWKPGCHVHAYLPVFALWPSHPFSVAWAEEKSAEQLETSLNTAAEKAFDGHDIESRAGQLGIALRRNADQQINGQTGIASARANLSQKHRAGDLELPHEISATTVSLIMRARTGMTRKLYKKAAEAPNGIIQTWGAIEGPYGGHESLASHGTVVLFAGGVGITHCVGYAHHLMKQYQTGTSSTQKILLVWSVPNTEALEWVRIWMDQILRMEGRRDVLRVQLFVTKPRNRGEVISNTGSVQMFPGRCNPQTIIEREFAERVGSLGVTVCGPGAFADSVRKAVRTVVTSGSVTFFEEGFTY